MTQDDWANKHHDWFKDARLELEHHGWDTLLDEFFATVKAAPAQVHVQQIKQKLGGLTIYIDCDKPIVQKALRLKLDELHQRSFETCELCGRPGERGHDRGQISVRCDQCRPDGWTTEQIWLTKE